MKNYVLFMLLFIGLSLNSKAQNTSSGKPGQVSKMARTEKATPKPADSTGQFTAEKKVFKSPEHFIGRYLTINHLPANFPKKENFASETAFQDAVVAWMKNNRELVKQEFHSKLN